MVTIFKFTKSMTRIQFLHALSAFFLMRFFKHKRLREPTEDVLWSGYLAGYQYADGEEVEHLIAPGTQLELMRESGNPHDELAILVRYKGRKIGYIPRSVNQIPAALIESGYKLIARVQYIDSSSPKWQRAYISVLMKNKF